MLSPDILIFSHARDEHAQAVLRRLPHTCTPLIIDLRDFGSGLVGSLNPLVQGEISLRLPSGEGVCLQSVQSVWWRRPTYLSAPKNCEERYKSFLEFEQKQFLDGLISLMPHETKFFNHPDAHAKMDRKAYQLRCATEVGLSIPATCITSDAAKAAEFLDSIDEAIYKSFWGTEDFWQPTRRVDKSIIENLHLLSMGPVIFQEYIEGCRDLRVTFVDGQVEVVAFDLNQSRYKYDVRIDTRIKASKHTLPLKIFEKIQKFCSLSELNYAAIDLRERPDGEFVFFEVNPAGQFLYLDYLAGTDLVGTFSSALSRSSSTPSHEKTGIRDGRPPVLDATIPLNAIGAEIAHLT